MLLFGVIEALDSDLRLLHASVTLFVLIGSILMHPVIKIVHRRDSGVG